IVLSVCRYSTCPSCPDIFYRHIPLIYLAFSALLASTVSRTASSSGVSPKSAPHSRQIPSHSSELTEDISSNETNLNRNPGLRGPPLVFLNIFRSPPVGGRTGQGTRSLSCPTR